MMRQRCTLTAASVMMTLTVLSLCAATQGSRLSVGYTMSKTTSLSISYSKTAKIRVNSIQKDQYVTGNILMAVGSALYTVTKFGDKTQLAGNLEISGYANGYKTNARFNEIAGFAQISYDTVLISDHNNRCIRKLDRYSGYVSTYAGVCDPLQSKRYIESYEYGKRFYGPRSMHFDDKTNILYLLDGENRIMSKDYSGNYKEVQYTTSTINDFVYDLPSRSFVISTSDHLKNISHSGSETNVAYAYNYNPYGLALSQGVLVMTDLSSHGVVKVYDTRTKYITSLTTLCSTYSSYPSCTLNKPSAVAIIDGKLYIGDVTNGSYYYTATANIHEISFFISDNVVTTSTAFWFPFSVVTTSTTSALASGLGWNSDTDNGNSYIDNDYNSDYSSSSSSGGVIAGIIVACIAAIGLKVGLIICCVYRWNYRLRYRQRFCGAQRTVVSVSSTSANPYGRLQESYNPVVDGRLPAPPAYSPPQQGWQQMQPGQPGLQPLPQQQQRAHVQPAVQQPVQSAVQQPLQPCVQQPIQPIVQPPSQPSLVQTQQA